MRGLNATLQYTLIEVCFFTSYVVVLSRDDGHCPTRLNSPVLLSSIESNSIIRLISLRQDKSCEITLTTHNSAWLYERIGQSIGQSAILENLKISWDHAQLSDQLVHGNPAPCTEIYRAYRDSRFLTWLVKNFILSTIHFWRAALRAAPLPSGNGAFTQRASWRAAVCPRLLM
jgi:hypothetical protein